MNVEKFFGKSQGINPEEDSLKEVVDEMKKIDEQNQENGGKGTVIFENKAGEKGKIKLGTEEVPSYEAEEEIEQKDGE